MVRRLACNQQREREDVEYADDGPGSRLATASLSSSQPEWLCFDGQALIEVIQVHLVDDQKKHVKLRATIFTLIFAHGDGVQGECGAFRVHHHLHCDVGLGKANRTRCASPNDKVKAGGKGGHRFTELPQTNVRCREGSFRAVASNCEAAATPDFFEVFLQSSMDTQVNAV